MREDPPAGAGARKPPSPVVGLLLIAVAAGIGWATWAGDPAGGTTAEPPPLPLQAAPVPEQLPEAEPREPVEPAAATDGQLTADQLVEVVNRHRTGLQRCYEAALRRIETEERVRLQIEIDIAPDGSVTSVLLQGESLPGMNTCIDERARRWRFPRASEPTTTRFPVVFQPGS